MRVSLSLRARRGAQGSPLVELEHVLFVLDVRRKAWSSSGMENWFHTRLRSRAALVSTLLLAACSGEKAEPTSNPGQLPPVVSYCGGAFRGFELPADPAARGPWQVGTKTVAVAGL